MSKEAKEELKNEARRRFAEDPSLDAKELAKDIGLKLSVCRAIKGRVTRKQKISPDELPTQAGQLRKILVDIRFNKIDAVLALVESYGFTVMGIFGALKDAAAPKSIIRYVLKRWSSYNQEMIPPFIQREIGNSPTGPTGYPGYQGYHAEAPSATRELSDLRVQNAKLEERLKISEEKRTVAEQNERAAQSAYAQEHERSLKAEADVRMQGMESRLTKEFDEKLAQRIPTGGSDLTAAMGVGRDLLKEGTRIGKTVEKFITSPGGVPPVPEQQQDPGNPDASNSVREQLRKKGMVTVIRERVVRK